MNKNDYALIISIALICTFIFYLGLSQAERDAKAAVKKAYKSADAADYLNTTMYQKAEDSLDVLWYQMMDSVKKSIHDNDYNKAGTYMEKASAYDHASNILYHFQFNQAIQSISKP